LAWTIEKAFIAAGKVGLDASELGQAIQLLQRLHSRFFGAGSGTDEELVA
jgi:hypothetical protein